MEAEHPLTRQIRLAEVGIEGQARLSRAALRVRGSEGGLVEFVYLHRAGIERLSLEPNLPAVPFEHASLFRHESARRLGAGAWRALRQIREVLALSADHR